MNAIVFICCAAAFFALCTLAAWYWHALAIVVAWCVRLAAQYIGFEKTYPIGTDKK